MVFVFFGVNHGWFIDRLIDFIFLFSRVDVIKTKFICESDNIFKVYQLKQKLKSPVFVYKVLIKGGHKKSLTKSSRACFYNPLRSFIFKEFTLHFK